MRPPKFSFIIVTYNNANTIEPCLNSILALTTDPYEIIIVDNSPDDRTLTAVRRFVTTRRDVVVRVVEPQENVGFSKACNLGTQEATGEYLFFLNPDTQLVNDASKLLARCLDMCSTPAAVGPAIVNSAGRVERSCRNLPTLGRVILDATGLDKWFGAYKLLRFSHDLPRQVEQVIGAAVLVRRLDYERLGGMDERFFVYFEEVDFCKRMRDAGGEIWFWPEARVQHLGGRSCESSSVRARMIFVLRQSRKKYFKKHFGSLVCAGLEIVNRLEGLQKSLILVALWMLQRKRSYRDQASGYWAVMTGIAPRA